MSIVPAIDVISWALAHRTPAWDHITIMQRTAARAENFNCAHGFMSLFASLASKYIFVLEPEITILGAISNLAISHSVQ